MREEIRRYALENALKYGKPPRMDAVLKRILGEHPELRSEAREVSRLVREEIKAIETMSAEEWVAELGRMAPEAMEEKSREDHEAELKLPELPMHNGIERVIMRFAPNPNGAATLGSARGIIINSEYAKMYNGRFILRFDDTDPVLKRPLPEAYEWYLEDCEWLDAVPDDVIVASERMDLYYHHVEELISRGFAYVCFCTREEFKSYKDHKVACPHRDAEPEVNMEYWDKMLGGAYEEKEAVLRIKTDMSNDDPALRDWVAFRILKREHPRVGARYIVWPTLDFESAIEDHMLGITHILRGKDLMKSEKRQRFIYDYFGWRYPVTALWGKIKVLEFGKFSTSELRRGIERGEYDGWDDPRLPTVRALRRRGFQPEAIRRFFIAMGISQNDISVSMKNLYAENRKLVDPHAMRYFFVRRPVLMELRNGDSFTAMALKHPSGTDYREIRTGNRVYISGDDYARLREGQRIRLKYLCTVVVESRKPLVADIKEEKKEDFIIHWAPDNGIRVRVKKPDGMDDEGIGEPLIASERGKVVQFERYGFVRIDSVYRDLVIAYFTH